MIAFKEIVAKARNGKSNLAGVDHVDIGESRGGAIAERAAIVVDGCNDNVVEDASGASGQQRIGRYAAAGREVVGDAKHAGGEERRFGEELVGFGGVGGLADCCEEG